MFRLHGLPFLLLILLALGACDARRGSSRGGSRGGDDDDTAGDDDDTGSGAVPGTVLVTEVVNMHPNETAISFGFTECQISLSSTLSEDPSDPGCPSCDGLWSGPVSGVSTDCDGVTPPEEVRYGFAWMGSAGIDIWSYDTDTGEWSNKGVAGPDGDGGWLLESEELLGDKTFELGTMDTAITLQAGA